LGIKQGSKIMRRHPLIRMVDEQIIPKVISMINNPIFMFHFKIK
jgi:hypothetical protein